MLKSTWTAVGVFLAGAFSIASAQINSDKIMDNNIETLELGRPWLEYGLAALFIIVILALGVKASKRSEAKGPTKSS